jgi:hypothetical protein
MYVLGVWFGGRLTENLDDLEWISTGQQATYSRWGAGEPDTVTGDYCVELNSDEDMMKWYTWDCEMWCSSICEHM